MAQISTHATDLYILPETQEERAEIIRQLTELRRSFTSELSNVEGQSWYGKLFIEVPFGSGLEFDNITINPDPARR